MRGAAFCSHSCNVARKLRSMSQRCSSRTAGKVLGVAPLRAGSSPLPEETGNPGRSLSEERVQIPTASLNCYTKYKNWCPGFAFASSVNVTITLYGQNSVGGAEGSGSNTLAGSWSSHLSYCGGGLMLLACTSGPLSKARGLPGAAKGAGLLTDVS